WRGCPQPGCRSRCNSSAATLPKPGCSGSTAPGNARPALTRSIFATSSDAMQPQVFADGCRLVPSRDAGIGCRRTALLTVKNTAAGREVPQGRELRLFASELAELFAGVSR